MEYNIEAHPMYTVSKFNFHRFRFIVSIKYPSKDRKCDNDENIETNFLQFLEGIFEETLSKMLQTEIFKNKKPESFKIGTKIYLNNYTEACHIEFRNTQLLSGSVILNRLSHMFQSGRAVDISNIDIIYSVIFK